ncbi:MAG TPA: glycosyltransferase family 2 protein [Aromatoleum sp.]|uniref:glycosyltransferase family 2 protein n=1 Tax=Aromatoleum sp. TaxID=2307007 RepID=UPI002B45F359|nr:glycosyltransferase family 2 protein [Aromatoleum sp.]HJV25098.1 glycosyltransferase family 2 protein [Aromatoleum sp.]
MPIFEKPPTVTVITPTYDRAPTLRPLFESLERQRHSVHEWILVDDGSKDNTADVVEGFRQAAKNIQKIVYIRQVNSGKHVAVNNGLNHSTGDYVAIVDSDDWLNDESLENFYRVLRRYNVNDCEGICGISGVKTNASGKAISHLGCEGGEIATHFEWFYLRKNFGDRIDFYKSEVFLNRRFNVFPGERFLTEDALWLTIPGKKIFSNESMLCGEYLPGGLTSRSARLLLSNPFGTLSYYFALAREFRLRNESLPLKLCGLFLYYAFLSIWEGAKTNVVLGALGLPVIALYKFAKR